jgi:glycosyltransferase involved in cell wall biosynthesis
MSFLDKKIKVNFVISHKSEIYIKDSTPCGERRLFEPDFWNELKKKAELKEIHLYRPFCGKTHFTQNVANVLYHLNNARTVWNQADRKAVTHILYGEESSILRVLPLKKTVVTCLDIIPISFPQGLSPHYRMFYKACVKGLKKADRILTVSDYTKKDLVKYLNIDPAKIKTAYWGINRVFQKREVPESFYYKYGFDPSRKHLLSVGALDSPRKNMAVLVKILPRLIKKDPGIRLILAGYKNDTTKNAVTEIIQKEHLNEYVHILEKVDDEDLCYLYNFADVFVFPTLYEGFGLPPVEAMACGTPVIASNNSSLPEAVGDAGILINPADEEDLTAAIIKLLHDEKLREDLIEKGFRHAKKFSWHTYAQDLYETYRELEEGKY